MPLIKGKAAKTTKGKSENIRREIQSGKSPAQSIAIALSVAKEKKKESLEINL